MKVHATLNNLRIAPRKVRLVTRVLVGVDVREALLQLSKQTKRSSQPVYTLLKSALANAMNNFGLDETNLFIQEIRVGDGLRLKRWSPKAFGRATPLLRRGSNITLILEEKVEGKNRSVKKKAVTEGIAESVAANETATAGASTPSEKLETKKGNNKSIKPAVGKVAKKVFQRKSM